MMASLILGLSAAVCWGVADFVARYTSREVGAFRSLFFMQAFGFGLLNGFWIETRAPAALPAASGGWGWAAVVGVLSAGGSLALYRSFEKGTLAVVAPISAGYPALTALLAMASGDHVGGARWAGIALVLAGVALTVGAASNGQAEPKAMPRSPRAGVGCALVAAVSFGAMFWLLGFRVVPALGGLRSVWVLRLVGAVGLGAIALPARQSLRLPRPKVLWMLAAVGVLDTSAYLLNNFGMEFHHVSVVTVLVSLYAAVTVLLAAAILRERLNGKQWLGVALIFAGIVVLAL